MPEERFRLPLSSYEELTKIIKAYGHISEEAAPGDVSKVAAMHPTIVSRNNAFLVSVGILEGGRKKKITEGGRALAGALEHEMPDEIRDGWRELVLRSDFLQKVISLPTPLCHSTPIRALFAVPI